MKKYQTWIFAAVGVVIVAIVALLVKNSQPATVQKNLPSEKVPAESPAATTVKSRPGELVGILKDSDNIERGNLMLVMSDRSVYLNTLRDFQALVGKRVVLKIDGTLQSFRLINIIAAP